MGKVTKYNINNGDEGDLSQNNMSNGDNEGDSSQNTICDGDNEGESAAQEEMRRLENALIQEHEKNIHIQYGQVHWLMDGPYHRLVVEAYSQRPEFVHRETTSTSCTRDVRASSPVLIFYATGGAARSQCKAPAEENCNCSEALP